MDHLRAAWALSTLLSLLVLVTCGGDDAPSDVRGGPPPGSAACVPGELTLPDGSCQQAGLPPDMGCPPGERALPTSVDGSCQPAGVPPEACAAGRFVPDGRGGCEAILPEEACPFGEMAVPGESACREVAPCGEGPWGNIPVEATTQHVDQGYPGSDSDGSREKPWTTVQAGVRAASPGAIVAVAEGRYAEDVLVFGKPVRLWGRCPARTEVVGLGAQQGAIAVARAGASGSEVRGLAATGPDTGIVVQGARAVVLEEVWVHDAGEVGVFVDALAGVTLRGALLEQNDGAGVLVEGSEATVEATVLRANRPNGAGEFGHGVSVEPHVATGERGKLWLTGSLVEANHGIGVYVEGSEATVEATVVRATGRSGVGEFGQGISVGPDPDTGEPGTLSLTASLVEENHGIGVYVESSEATIAATVVRATRPNDAGPGRGIVVQPHPDADEPGKLRLTASLVEENREVGVFVAGSEATVEATVVRATQPAVTGKTGWGISVQPHPAAGQRGKLWLTASLVEENHEIGVNVESSEATVEATVVRATQPNGAGAGGRGINVKPDTATDEGGKLWLTASLVEENHEVGVYVAGSEATVEATAVRATQPNGAGEFGRGIVVEIDATTGERGKLWLTASLVEENHDVGVYVAGSEATVEATVVRATQPNGDGTAGRGINVQPYPAVGEGAKLSLAGSIVEENHEMAVYVEGSEATIEATVVRATQPNGAGEFGRGINVQPNLETGEGRKLWLTASLVEENHDVGVYVAGSEATVEATVVRATQPNGAGKYGRGINLQAHPDTGEPGKLRLTASLVEEHHDVGVFVSSSEATIEETVVRATKRAPSGLEFGDGILVLDLRGQSNATIAATSSTDNARAGVMYVGSTGELSFVRSSGNRFGLVLQPGMSGAEPTLGEGNAFEGNAERDTLAGGDLPVPDVALPVP